MSKHHVSHVQTRVMYDARTMTHEELELEYDLDIAEDGSVWDKLEQKEFDTLNEWAQYTADLENDDNYGHLDKIGGNYYDDDY